MIEVPFIKTHEESPTPKYMTPGSAGADLHSMINAVLEPGETRMFTTGLRVEIPAHHFGLVTSRSSMARKGIVVANAPGVVDSDYRGDMNVLLFNRTKSDYHVKKGDRIAQLLIVPVEQVRFIQTEELSDTHRGEGGFGSTGS